MNKEEQKKTDTKNSYLIDESDENTDSVKHPKESHLTPNQSEAVVTEPPQDMMPAGYDSPYLNPSTDEDEGFVQNANSVSLSDLKSNTTLNQSFQASNPSLTTEPISKPETFPLSNPQTIPSTPIIQENRGQSPEVIPVAPKAQYAQVAKVKKGGGILGYLFMKMFNCVGCLLLIISLIIVGFTVWIINF
jgi:hypothetical protein